MVDYLITKFLVVVDLFNLQKIVKSVVRVLSALLKFYRPWIAWLTTVKESISGEKFHVPLRTVILLPTTTSLALLIKLLSTQNIDSLQIESFNVTGKIAKLLSPVIMISRDIYEFTPIIFLSVSFAPIAQTWAMIWNATIDFTSKCMTKSVITATKSSSVKNIWTVIIKTSTQVKSTLAISVQTLPALGIYFKFIWLDPITYWAGGTKLKRC